MAKLGMLVGLGAGYVLGARAGRQRYDALAAKALKFWSDPRVQRQAARSQDVVQEKASHMAGVAQERVSHAAGSAMGKVPGFGNNDSDAGSTATNG